MMLDELAIKYGTDKGSDHHNYCETYQHYFGPIKDDVTGLLEIGIGGKNFHGVAGGSLKMWEAYFTNAHICGVDIDPSAQQDYGPRISAVIGDQTLKSVLDQAIATLPSVDIIIDDGSHMNNLTVATFEYLFEKLRPGGWYVIEDTVCIGELRLGNLRSQIETLIIQLMRGIETNGRILTKKNMADFNKINEDYVLNQYERWVESVSLHRGLYFIKKRGA